MVRRIEEDELEGLVKALLHEPAGLTLQDIAQSLSTAVPKRTLQYRLRVLIERGQIVMKGRGRAARYALPESPAAPPPNAAARAEHSMVLPLSEAALAIQADVRKPPGMRTPVGYDRQFLNRYRPNETFYLTQAQRAHLRAIGTPTTGEQPAGTYARNILDRLLIDLSWNSSRLEGNTYSLLDTQRLLDLGEEAEGKGRLEAQMILNHKEAIEFLVGNAEEIGFNRHTILNLHALLADSLLGVRLISVQKVTVQIASNGAGAPP